VKTCDRCGGQTTIAHDIYGKYWICVQCGDNRDTMDAPYTSWAHPIQSLYTRAEKPKRTRYVRP
jgi:hypothetical protein